MKLCKCGCKKEIKEKPHHKYFGIPDYLLGHNKANKGKFKNTNNRNTMYTRSKEVLKPNKCVFSHLNQCKGRFEIHHIDQDIKNNKRENLIQLCTSHHRLVHNGKFDINSPKKLKFRVDASGKRRYL